MFGLGGKLVKEVAFVFMFYYYFVQAHFGFPFYKGVLLKNLLFQNLDLLLQPKFLCVLPST